MLISIYMQKKHLIYIILFMIINITSECVLTKLDKNKNFHDLIYCICESCLILFYIIEKYLSKNENDEYNENNKILIEVISLIICYLIFNFISIYLSYNRNKINEVEDYMILIIFLILIEKICFENYFYSHQILSIIIIFILFLYFLISNIIQSKLKIFYILIFLEKYSESYKYHLIKYINMKYFINIYLLGSINGIFGLIQHIIQYYIKYKFNFPQFNLYNICLIILLFILLMINVYLEYKIISELGPIHRFMTDFISIYIQEIIINKKFDLILIGLLLIICCLIYLEIIQLNFCNLNKNLKINIANRMIEGLQKDISSFSQYNSELESESELVNRTQD